MPLQIPTLQHEGRLQRSCSRKKRYGTDVQASVAIGKCKYHDPLKNLRYYKCYFCDGYHITHTEKL